MARWGRRVGMRELMAGVLGFLVMAGMVSAVAEPEEVVGPMVGHVTEGNAGLWLYLPGTAEGLVKFGKEGAKEMRSEEFERVADPVGEGKGGPATVELSGLESATRYTYEVWVDGKTDPRWRGKFATAPAAGSASAFRMAVTSCMKKGQVQSSWYLLLAQQPDLHLTLGDTHYADTTDPAVQLKHHLEYRRHQEFATVLRSMPTYAMWDDHDYGPNNSDGTAEGKENSLRGWKQFWVNPGAGTADTPGAFYRFVRGDVEFFVVDGRYHRSPDKVPDDENKRMLGDAQFAWLLEGLKTSKAKFKVIASGSTLQHSQVDGWRIYTFSRHRLFDAIRENKIGGVMYCSGDIHASYVEENAESERVGYPLVEVLSSGVANSKTLSFATVDFDTTLKDPEMRVRIVYGDGTVRDDRTWRLSELQVK